MKDNVHIHINNDISKKIRSIASEQKIKLSDAYELVLSKGLEYRNIIGVLDTAIEDLNKNQVQILYIKRLLQQIYADLSLEQVNLNESENLINFNNMYRNGKNKLID